MRVFVLAGLRGLEPRASSLSGKPRLSATILNRPWTGLVVDGRLSLYARYRRGCHPVRHSARQIIPASRPPLRWGGRDAIVRLVSSAGRYDQRNCGGGNRQQCDQAGGLSPPGLGRLPDLTNQSRERVAVCLVVHLYLLSDVRPILGPYDQLVVVIGSVVSGDTRISAGHLHWQRPQPL